MVFFDNELKTAIGEPLTDFLVNSFQVYRETLGIGLYFARNQELTATEKLAYIVKLYEKFIRTGIDLLPYYPEQNKLDVLKAIHRLNILSFARLFVHAALQEDMKTCEKIAEDTFLANPVILDGNAKYFDCAVFLYLLERSKSSAKSYDKNFQEVQRYIETKLGDTGETLTIADAEKIIRMYLEENNIRNIQPNIQKFRDKVVEWNIVRNIPKTKFIEWLIDLVQEEKFSNSQRIGLGTVSSTLKSNEPVRTKISDKDRIITVIYQDVTGERKYIGENSKRALDAGLFQAIRPGEILRQFGIQMKSLEFTVTDPDFPSWIWLNQETSLAANDKNVGIQESSIFTLLKREPNIRNLDNLHGIIHKILEGKERRLTNSGDELIKDIIYKMLEEVLILEKVGAAKLFEGKSVISTGEGIGEKKFEPHFLLNFRLTKQTSRLNWDTIEVWGKTRLTREEFATSGYPWVLDSTNRFRDVLIDLFSRRLSGDIFMKKSSFLYEKNLYFTIADVNPDTLKARIIVFKTEEKGSLNYVDIRRRYDLLVSQPPNKFGFKNLLAEMNASDVQLVLDKLTL